MIKHPEEGIEVSNEASATITSSGKKLHQLPIWYTSVPPDTINMNNPRMPQYYKFVESDVVGFKGALDVKYTWLEQVFRFVEEDLGNNKIGWSAFHAVHTEVVPPKCQTSLLPLFPDSSNSAAMIKHTMDIVMKAVQFLNPTQTAMLTGDQPLYALGKQIQWAYPEKYGLDRIVIFFGGLHIEMAAFKTAVEWLEGSGWNEALVHAGIATVGTAESLLHASHLKRSRYVHQVFAAALYALQRNSFNRFCNTHPAENLSFDDWSKQRYDKYPQFKFWAMTLELELTILLFIRSIRTSNFALYISVLQNLLPWFFALDRIHYSRWLSVHVQDMLTLQSVNPDLAKEFLKGKFTVQKTSNVFSSMAIDQAHEQNNKLVKGDGGAIGLTENWNGLCRWMLAGPETARILQEFEENRNISKTARNDHHEMTSGTQTKFKKDIVSLISSLEEFGNPFDEESGELISLASKVIADQEVIETMNNLQSIGLKNYESFVKERLVDCTQSVMDAIHKNKLSLFKVSKKRTIPGKITSIKTDMKLFARLYIGCQARAGNLEEFFSHENQAHPPSLADSNGSMRHCTKADILTCLQDMTEKLSSTPDSTAVILDGAVIVQMLRPKSGTFYDYCHRMFIPYVGQQFKKAVRVDLVWDEYRQNSLKANTRNARGTGIRTRVESSVKIPTNWQAFLRVDDNKKGLFNYLSEEVLQYFKLQNKDVYATLGEDVHCSQVKNLSYLMPCTHEEADTRLMLHCRDAVLSGHLNLTLRTVDSDVVVIAVAHFHIIGASELWISFGTGKHHRYIGVHEISKSLGPNKSLGLPFFHAFTGCDTVSSFGGRGKKTAWDTWTSFPDVTGAFLDLSYQPTCVSLESLSLLERFVVLMYDRTRNLSSVCMLVICLYIDTEQILLYCHHHHHHLLF